VFAFTAGWVGRLAPVARGGGELGVAISRLEPSSRKISIRRG
jgi:hypothetical protein